MNLNLFEEEETRRLLLILSHRVSIADIPRSIPKSLNQEMKTTEEIPQVVKFQGEMHFDGYNYLGPKTQFRKRQRLGIEPVNQIDRIAMEHDRLYSQSARSEIPLRLATRALADLGAGGGMIIAASFNQDLKHEDRVIGWVAGAGLITQGLIRTHFITAAPAAIIDYLLY